MFQGSFTPDGRFGEHGVAFVYQHYYTSPTLFNHLYTRGINACGTAR